MPEVNPMFDILIIGGGPAGYTAAIYAANFGYHTALVERGSPAGQMATAAHIENYPGFPEGIDGWSLLQKMRQQAENAGAEIIAGEVTNLVATKKTAYTATDTLEAKALIIATGAAPKRLGVDGEEALLGRGVSYCASCDGMFYRGRSVAVVGGGNSAVTEALHLSQICREVHLLHRREALRANRNNLQALMQRKNIILHTNQIVTSLLHNEKLTGITVDDTLHHVKSEISVDGLFICIGREPETKILHEALSMDKNGYLIADDSTLTSVPGVFAAGDVRTKEVRQITTAVADGTASAYSADKYLRAQILAGADKKCI